VIGSGRWLGERKSEGESGAPYIGKKATRPGPWRPVKREIMGGRHNNLFQVKRLGFEGILSDVVVVS